MIECVLVVINNVSILYFQWPNIKKQQQINKIKQNKKVVLHVAPKKIKNASNKQIINEWQHSCKKYMKHFSDKYPKMF